MATKKNALTVKTIIAKPAKIDPKAKAPAVAAKVKGKEAPVKTAPNAPRQLRFLGHPITETPKDMEAIFAKLKPEALEKARSYHVRLGKLQIAIPQLVEKMTGVKLEWRIGPGGGPVGTYSTGTAAKILVRAGFTVIGKDGQPLVVEATEPKAKAVATDKGTEKKPKPATAKEAAMLAANARVEAIQKETGKKGKEALDAVEAKARAVPLTAKQKAAELAKKADALAKKKPAKVPAH